jgi:hypothetical protein
MKNFFYLYYFFFGAMLRYFILYFLLFSIKVSAQVNVENDSIIIWNKERKITWDDFLSKDYEVYKYDIGGAGIATTIDIYPKRINCSNLEMIRILPLMHKKKSWVEDNTASLLNHEQTHFNIAEVFARKIRKAIAEHIEQNEICDLQAIVDIYYRLEEEYRQTQILYDQETKHNLNFEKQQEWDKNISCMLEVYKEYELIIDIDDLELE